MSAWTPAFRRHLWLGQAVVELRVEFDRAGLRLPPRVLVATGSTMLCADGSAALGQCSPSTSRADRLPRIVISSTLDEPTRVLDVLVHELIHAADDCASPHGDWFQAWARHLGLGWNPGRPDATYASQTLRKRLEGIADLLGSYPAERSGFNLTGSGLVAA